MAVIAVVALGQACFLRGGGGAEVTPTPPPLGAQGIVEMARDDLARRLSIPKDKIAVAQVTSVNWSNTSLGCPQPGMSYAAVITPGFRIILSYQGQEYRYHSDDRSTVIFCP
ncbi:MAG: hypothetical protein HYU86_05475 [Chloroflexi bacterium]|nr:hypothetical protein [Chloroflexota bacterium]